MARKRAVQGRATSEVLDVREVAAQTVGSYRGEKHARIFTFCVNCSSDLGHLGVRVVGDA